jgi:hypothetical protein
MWQLLASLVDAFHALAMAAWVVGMPLLFWHKWPRLSRAYSAYALSFIVLYQASRWFLGECFLTTIARALWQRGTPPGGAPPSNEWFTVRLAQAVFELTPSHRSIIVTAQVLVLVTALGALLTLRARHLDQRMA